MFACVDYTSNEEGINFDFDPGLFLAIVKRTANVEATVVVHRSFNVESLTMMNRSMIYMTSTMMEIQISL